MTAKKYRWYNVKTTEDGVDTVKTAVNYHDVLGKNIPSNVKNRKSLDSLKVGGEWNYSQDEELIVIRRIR